jgi:hypothetical protein
LFRVPRGAGTPVRTLARGRRHPLNLFLILTITALATAPVAAHEPLWGETPSVFAFGVIHPEVRVGFTDSGRVGRRSERQRLFEAEWMVQYAPTAALNLMLEIPWMESRRETRIDGRRRSANLGGLGDVRLLAKRRFAVHQDVGLSLQHSLIYGLKLPTGASRQRDADGERASPHDQPGTGRPGLVLGYAWDRERLRDTLWASLEYGRDLGGGFRMGDMLEANVAYGWWVVQPNEAREPGLNLAFGIHGEVHAADPIGAGRFAGNSHRLAGLHFTPIVTQGNHQFRVGVLIPFVRSGPADHTDYPFQVRIAFETFF